MKKNILFAAIAILILSASCTQQDDFMPGNEAKTFIATIEQAQTRTTLADDDVTVKWSEKDEIDINGATYSAAISGKNSEAIFHLKSGVAPKEGPYRATYPASLCQDDGKGNRVITFPQIQYYEPDKLNVPMIAISNTEELTFHNICGVICFSLTGMDKILGIQVGTDGQSLPLWGDVNVDENYKASIVAPPSEKGKGQAISYDQIILDCGENGLQLDASEPVKLYMYLPETTFPEKTMHISVIGMEGIEKQSYVLVADNAVTVERNHIYTLNLTIPAFGEEKAEEVLGPVLTGVFSVSANKTVKFSRGNLQATNNDGKWTWDFAPQQYDYIGEKNVVQGKLGSKIDLFGWSSTSKDNNFGIFTATMEGEGSEYFGTGCEFKDWGNNVNLAGRTWTTLSAEEWRYLLTRKEEANEAGSYFKAKINDVCGLLLLPDYFAQLESYAEYKSIFSKCQSDATGAFLESSLTTEEWTMLQDAGCVFLPCAGSREGTTIPNVIGGYYWSSTSGRGLAFGTNGVSIISNMNNYYGRSVRLVTVESQSYDSQLK